MSLIKNLSVFRSYRISQFLLFGAYTISEVVLLQPVETMAVLFSASSLSFFSVNMITHEPQHVAW